jgi:hypothetical protein
VFFDPYGEVCFAELKAEGRRMSEAQAAIKHHLIEAGHGYHCSSDYRDVIETLKAWGRAVRRRHHLDPVFWSF